MRISLKTALHRIYGVDLVMGRNKFVYFISTKIEWRIGYSSLYAHCIFNTENNPKRYSNSNKILSYR